MAYTGTFIQGATDSDDDEPPDLVYFDEIADGVQQGTITFHHTTRYIPSPYGTGITPTGLAS